MKKEEQVCTLEQAKRLKELGVDAPSLFYWKKKGRKEFYLHYSETPLEFKSNEQKFFPEFYHAYTVAELGEILPDALTSNDKAYFSRSYNDIYYNSGWWYYYINNDLKVLYEVKNQPSEAAARAAMLIHLLQNGIISPSKTTKQ